MIRAASSRALLRRPPLRRSLPPPSASLSCSPRAAPFHATARREEQPAHDGSASAAPAAAASEPEKSKGWWDPFYAVPLGIAAAVPALHYEWLLITEETQLAACFIAFTAVLYKQFGGAFKDYLEEDGKKILEEHNRQEDAVITLLQDKIDDIRMQSRVVQDAEDVKALKLATYGKLGEAGKVKPLYDFRSQMERMLSLVEAEEASLKEKAKHALMDEATAAVTARFASSADLKKSSLAGAIAALKGTAAGGKGGAAAPAAGGGPDVVQAAYIQFFKDKQKASQKVDEAAEAAAARRAIVTKLNAVATNEGFLFDFDPATGAPRMAA